MSHTFESIKNQLQKDISESNSKTGANDTNIHDAMTRLMAGFGNQSGGDITLQAKTVDPSTLEKTYYPDEGYDGFGSVKVNAVTSSIDSNIKSENIKSGVTILGVQGSYEGTGGIDTSDANATASDILSGKTAYVKGSKVTGNIPTVTQPNPTVSVNSSGLITASYTPNEGYTSNTNEKKATKQLTVQSAQTIAPSTSDKTIASGTYLTGTQTIKGDVNLVPENIKEGVSIFGVTGSHSGGGGGGADEYCNVTITCMSYTSYVGYIDGTLDSVYLSKNVSNQVVRIKKGTQLTFIDESGIGIHGVSVNNGINFIGRAYMGSSEAPYLFVTFDITDNCTIQLT